MRCGGEGLSGISTHQFVLGGVCGAVYEFLTEGGVWFIYQILFKVFGTRGRNDLPEVARGRCW
jgi:hypothetical protein